MGERAAGVAEIEGGVGEREEVGGVAGEQVEVLLRLEAFASKHEHSLAGIDTDDLWLGGGGGIEQPFDDAAVSAAVFEDGFRRLVGVAGGDPGRHEADLGIFDGCIFGRQAAVGEVVIPVVRGFVELVAQGAREGVEAVAHEAAGLGAESWEEIGDGVSGLGADSIEDRVALRGGELGGEEVARAVGLRFCLETVVE